MLVFDDDDDAEATSKDSANGNPSFTRAKRVSFTMTTRERAMNLIQRKLWSVSRCDASTCRRLGVESCGWSRARTRRNARAFVGSRRSGARGCASRCDASIGSFGARRDETPHPTTRAIDRRRRDGDEGDMSAEEVRAIDRDGGGRRETMDADARGDGGIVFDLIDEKNSMRARDDERTRERTTDDVLPIRSLIRF
jgi:hypothetical protein